jgi:nucleotidyltransferase substrate binding protein (TIGR01987 family)
MENQDVRWKQRFGNYCEALNRVEEIAVNFTNLTEIEKDALIHRFEFTVDLSWKVMQDYLKYAGYINLKGPRACITQMATDGILDQYHWEEIIECRNTLSHIYNEEKSRLLLDQIIFIHLPNLRLFRSAMLAL